MFTPKSDSATFRAGAYGLVSVQIITSLFFAFSGVALAAGPASVNLGTAGNFVILSKTGISTTGTTQITGDIGASPVAASYLTGFSLIADSTNTFSTSALLTGHAYAADYATPTPAMLTAAVADMMTAYTDAAGRTLPIATELGAGDISGLTIAPGLYKWGTGVSVNSEVTLSGGPNDVWIFQIAQDLTVASSKKVILSGGAQAKNVFWQVAGQATVGTTAHLEGILLTQTAVHFLTGASLSGRALAQTAVTLQSNVVTNPGSASVSSTPPPASPTPTPTSPTPTTQVVPSPNPTPQPTATQVSTPTPTPTSTPTAAVQTPTITTQPITVPTNSRANAQALTSLTQSSPAAASMPLPVYTRALSIGSSGDEVTNLQLRLTDEGVYSGPITGYFGALTRAGVRAFQAKFGLPQAGVVGPLTRATLNS